MPANPDKMFDFVPDMLVSGKYHDPKFSDRHIWANSVDLDQTALQGALVWPPYSMG